ncbi:MAG: glycosyltransferase family 4 protein [Thermoplasmata archaeon]
MTRMIVPSSHGRDNNYHESTSGSRPTPILNSRVNVEHRDTEQKRGANQRVPSEPEQESDVETFGRLDPSASNGFASRKVGISSRTHGEKLNIVMFTPSFHPSLGGVERHVKRVAEELVRLGHEVVIITRSPDDTQPREETLDGIQVFRMQSNRRTRIWKWIWAHRALILNADVVHCHDFTSYYHWYLPFRLIYFWKPVFLTFHGFEKYPPEARSIRKRKICEHTSSGHICIGEYIKKWYGTECEIVLWGAVDSPNHEDGLQDQKEDAVVFVGRLEKDTSVLGFFQGLNLFGERTGKRVRVYVCGSGSLLESLEKSGCVRNHNVTFLGKVDDALPYFSRCKYAFVSGYLAILEAMASKAIVFSLYDNPLKKECLSTMPHQEEVMVLCSSPEDLAEKFQQVREDSELQKRITSRAVQLTSEMTWERIAREYLRLYARKIHDR